MKTVLKLPLMVLGTAAYLGLSVLGSDGFTAFSSHPVLTALAAVTAALTVAAFFGGDNLSLGVREDRGNRRVLPVFFLIGLLAGYHVLIRFFREGVIV